MSFCNQIALLWAFDVLPYLCCYVYPCPFFQLFVDKDTIVNAMGASHDVHLVKIDNREDEIVTRSSSWISTLMQQIHKQETKRNRERVSEITNYINHLSDDLNSIEFNETMENVGVAYA